MKSKLKFGTDGIRGNASQFPFTNEALFHFGHAIGRWSKKKYANITHTPHVLIGSDSRTSCNKIKKALTKGLSKQGIIISDSGILPTPAVLNIIQNMHDYTFGIVISASHNHYTDNGIKLFDAETGKISDNDENSLVSYYEKIRKNVPASDLKSIQLQHDVSSMYEQNILETLPSKFLSSKKIVLDCAHGATYKIAPRLFKKLGAEVITLHTEPNGTNINQSCGTLNPQKLQHYVIEKHADIGFAFDGDGDRVIAVNSAGEIKNGDDILALLLDHPLYSSQSKVVGTIMTNVGLEKFLKKNKKTLIRTKVGDKYIAQSLKSNNLLLGGENSGHIILYDYLPSGDGIFVALRLMEVLIISNNWDMQTFTKYPQILVNVPISHKKDLKNQKLANIIAATKNTLNAGRLIVRYSGTENVLRVMAEDSTHKSAHHAAHTLAQELQKELS